MSMPESSRRGDTARARRAARELAATPVVDPYRGQLHAVRTEPPAIESAAAASPSPATSDLPPVDAPGPETGWRATAGAHPATTPSATTAASMLAMILAVFAAVFGLGLITFVILAHTLPDVGDRSFYAGSDARDALIGVLDLGLCGLGIVGAIGLSAGRLAGRIAVTVFGWTMLGLSVYWLDAGRTTPVLPLVAATTSVLVLLLSYHASVTRWLGVLPHPQPQLRQPPTGPGVSQSAWGPPAPRRQ
jgi:hypothetical protein